MFLDPPYYLENKSSLYGNNGDMHENFEHDDLYEILKTKSNWLLTYNNCDYIKNLYKENEQQSNAGIEYEYADGLKCECRKQKRSVIGEGS